jgi:hypothetical protein
MATTLRNLKTFTKRLMRTMDLEPKIIIDQFLATEFDQTLFLVIDDPYMKFLGGFITYKGKGVPGLIKEKMERGLENIDKCLAHDEHKVRIYKEYFLPANHFIVWIHDLTKTDLGVVRNQADRNLFCPKRSFS